MGKIFLTISILLFSICSSAQGVNEPTTFGGTTYNIIVHKPTGWNSSQKWPAIIFLVGAGEVGSDPAKAYQNGPNHWIQQGWNGEVTLGDSTFKPVIATFQTNANVITPPTEARGIDTIVARYSVDTSRIYVTGLSRGAQAIIRAMTDTTVNIATRNKYNRFTAAVPMSEGKNIGAMFHRNLDYYAMIGGSQFVLRGSTDGSAWITDSVTIPMNNSRPGSAIGYDWTLSDASGTSHCCWNDLYDPAWTHNGLNIYQWMLGHSKRPYASAGQTTINTFGSSVTLNGLSRQYAWGWNGWGTLTKTWTKVSGPSGGTITSSSSDTTAVTALEAGTYVFRFTTQTGSGATATQDVTVNVSSTPPDPDGEVKIIKMRGRKLVIKSN